jgi:transcriptional regulator GlxA family with amidase domain
MAFSVTPNDVDRMVELIEHRSAEPLRLGDLARAIGCTEQSVGTLFRTHVGVTFRAYLAHCRIMRAANSISVGDKIEAVALESGYRSKKNFYKQFRRYFGTTPGNYRKDRTVAEAIAIGQPASRKAAILPRRRPDAQRR